jgi:hypothetical protein
MNILENRNAELIKQNQSLAANDANNLIQLEELKDKIKITMQDKDSLFQKKQELVAERAALTSANQKLQAEKANSEEQRTRLQSKYLATQEKSNLMSSKNSELTNSVKQLETSKAAWAQKYQDAAEKLAISTAEFKEILLLARRDNLALTQQKQSMASENIEWKKQKTAAEQNYNIAMTKLKQLVEQNNALTKESQLQAQQKQTLKANQMEKTELEKQFNALQLSLADARQEVQQLKALNQKLDIQLQDARSAAVLSKKEIKSEPVVIKSTPPKEPPKVSYLPVTVSAVAVVPAIVNDLRDTDEILPPPPPANTNMLPTKDLEVIFTPQPVLQEESLTITLKGLLPVHQVSQVLVFIIDQTVVLALQADGSYQNTIKIPADLLGGPKTAVIRVLGKEGPLAELNKSFEVMQWWQE